MTGHAVPYTGILEKERLGRKQGVLVTAFLSLISVVLTLPFIPWIWVVGDITPDIRDSYSILNFLSYVQNTKQGFLGLASMMLMLLAVASMILSAISIFRVLLKRYGQKGLLSFYAMTKGAMFLNFVATGGLFLFLNYAYQNGSIHYFAPTFAPYVIMVISIISYVCVTILERRERLIQHDHGFLKEFSRNWILFLFLIPCFIYFVINHYLPMVGVYFAFTQFNFKDGLFASPFVGLKNFEHLAKAELFPLTKNTILYNILFIVVGNIMQIIFAILISRVLNKRFKKVTQTMIFMPYFVSFVILRVLTYNLLEYDKGLINSLIVPMGFDRLDFYNSPQYWPLIITIFFLWKNLGYGMVVYLATIMGISDEYYEAARVDGANIFQQIRYITIPLLKPTFIILLLYSLGGIMRGQFELFYQLVGNNGVLFKSTDIIDTFVYRITTTQVLSMGMGAAAGLYQSVFGFLIIIITNFIIKRRNSEYALF